MTMDEEKLIEYVRKYPYLYDLNHPKYTDSVKKESTWKEISQKLKQPPDACKHRWQSLRDCFRRTLNKRKLKSDKSGKKWKYEEEMGFLTPYFTRKNALMSVDPSSEEEIADTAIEENIFTEQSNDSSSSDTAADTEETVAVTSRATSAMAPTNTRSVARKHIAKRMRPSTMIAPATLITTCSSDEKRKIGTTDYDELDYFFFNISATVRKFTPYQQAIAKNKIFSLVSDMEIQQFTTAPNLDNTTLSPIPSPASTNWTLSASTIVPTPNDWKREAQ